MTRKVLHVCPYLHPSAGGPVAVVLQYAERLARLGYIPSVLTTDWYSPGGKEEIEKRYAARYAVNVLCTGKSFLKAFTRMNRKLVREATKDADLLHIHGLWHSLGLLAMRYAWELRIPYVVSPHGMLDPYSMSVGAIKKRIYWRFFECRNMQRSARILFTTEDEQQLAVASVGPVAQGEVVLLGADDPPAEGRAILKNRALQRFPFLRGKKVVLFLGRLHEKKGLHTLVQLFRDVVKAVPNAFLLIVGDGEPHYKEFIRSHIKLLGIDKSVFFTGLLESQDKWCAIAVADLFALPSRQENFALAVAEVMKMGLPVLISDKVNLASCVKSASAGIVLSLDDLAAWSEVIAKLLKDENLLAGLGKNSQLMANRFFSWDTSSEALGKVYETVLRNANLARFSG